MILSSLDFFRVAPTQMVQKPEDQNRYFWQSYQQGGTKFNGFCRVDY